MADPDITTNLTDDDTIVLYRPLASTAKRKAMRTTFGTIKRIILNSTPTVQGQKGDTGPVGPQGVSGKDGNDGAVGPIGPAGPAGKDGASITGPVGPQGAAGKDGASITGPAGPVGQTGATGPSGKDGASIVGPAGPSGAVGQTGAIGPVGPAGVAGKDGVQGLMGPAGPDRIKFAQTITTATTGIATITGVPTTATVLIISPRGDGVVQKSVARSGTTVTIAFRQLNTGTLPAVVASLFATPAAVTFDFVAMEPTT